MNYYLLLIFGLAPSIIWLSFFLRKDSHPESNRMILKIFFFGALITLIAGLAETGIASGLANWIKTYPFLFFILYIFLGVAFVEEFLKYLVVREKVLNNPELDEPLDIMLYMIIAALGFAAVENILFLLPEKGPLLLSETIVISSLRFVGATLLHALASGTLGYFLALSFFETKKRLRLVAQGLITATLLHGLFNFSIIKIDESLMVTETGGVNIINFPLFISSLVFLIVLLLGLAIFVSAGFKKLKKLASICKVK